MIKAIIFDCFGVLVNDVMRTKANEVSEFSPALAENIFALMRAADRGIISRDEQVQQFAVNMGMSVEEVDKMLARGEARNESLLAEIPRLKKHFKIGLLSNVASRAWVEERLGKANVKKLFDAVIVSGEEGVIKPEPEIFLIAAERLKVKPQECLMVDDLQKNIDGAKAVGMLGIQYVSNAQIISFLNKVTK